MRRVATCILAMAGIGLTACVLPPLAPTYAPTQAPAYIPSSANYLEPASEPLENLKPVEIRRIVFKIPDGQSVGRESVVHYGRCVDLRSIDYPKIGMALDQDETKKTFLNELKKANYPGVGDPDALFKDTSRSQAELAVGAVIKKLTLDFCTRYDTAIKDYMITNGSMSLQVEWQIYDPFERRVVGQMAATGTSSVSERPESSLSELFYSSFADASRGLLNTAKFKALVRRDPGPGEAAAPAGAPIRVSGVRVSRANITGNMDRARSAVVTIVTATGHGSGFFISRDGYLITNYHVVEEARIAKIVLASGREVRGTIVARNARRDVALIKVELSSVPALAVASRALKVGATIYAIGAPRDTAWAGTVSQGIVSAKRNIDGQNFIQGDVNIQQGSSGGPLIDRHGNVIAVSVSGLENRGTATGLNFFIPIDEALASLNVKLK